MFKKLSLVAAAVALSAGAAQAQITSNVATVQLTANVPQSISVTVDGATSVTRTATLIAGVTSAINTPVAVRTAWNLNGAADVRLNASFATPAQALSSGGATPNYIPASLVEAQTTSGGALASWTAFSAGTLQLFSTPITSANQSSAQDTNLNLRFNLTSASNVAIGTYTGTLNLQASAL